MKMKYDFLVVGSSGMQGRITARGSFAPEAAVPAEEFFRELKKKGIIVFQDGAPIPLENHDAASAASAATV